MKTGEEYVNCPICDKDNTDLFRNENNWNLVKCRECSLIYVNPRPIQGGPLDKLYTHYSDDTYSEKINSYISDKPLGMLKARRLLHNIKRFKKNGRILDIGFGAGYFLLAAQDLGYEPFGVDTSQIFYDYAKDELGLNVSLGTIHQAYYPDNYFDVITMFNVLSHLDTPIHDFSEINRILKKDGLLVLETGNSGDLTKVVAEKYKLAWDAPEHLYWYSKDNLRELLRKTNFQLIKIDRYSIIPERLIANSKLAPFIRKIVRGGKLNRERKEQKRLPVGDTRTSIMTKIYAKINIFISYDLGRWISRRGSPASMIVFAKKC